MVGFSERATAMQLSSDIVTVSVKKVEVSAEAKNDVRHPNADNISLKVRDIM